MKKATNQPLKIGYQGRPGSFSEQAARRFAKQCFPQQSVEFVPLISSAAVMNELDDRRIDYAVVATKNSIGGEVEETMRVLHAKRYELVRADILDIHQCLFKMPGVVNEEITCIISHIQAIRQTSEYVKQHFPNAEVRAIEDTAIGAEMICKGEYSRTTAVICAKEAGKLHQLELVAADIHNQGIINRTEFRLFKLPEKRYVNSDSLHSPLVKDSDLLEQLIKVGVAGIIFLSIWIIKQLGLSEWGGALTISGYLFTLWFVIKTLTDRFSHKTFVGYWKYYAIPLNDDEEPQQYSIPRIVEIIEREGKYSLKIYTPNSEGKKINAISDRLYVSANSSTEGIALYEYNVHQKEGKEIPVKGISVLKWRKEHFYSRLNCMEGHFRGENSKGVFTWYKISPTEFANIKRSRFLVDV